MSPAPRLWPQYLGALLVVVLLAGVASASAALLQVQSITDIAETVGTEVDTATKDELDDVPPGQPQTLLLIGSDKRSKKSADGAVAGGSRSDTLMLVRLDPQQGSTAVLSIPRDTKAEIPVKGGGFRTGKINEAFSDGGERYSIRAVRKLLGVPVHHVIVINFGAFQRAVNRLGCLYQDIDRTYFNDNSSGGDRYATIDVKSGYQLLCGMDSLDWVRFRHLDNDFVRAARQQEFLRSAKTQVSASQIAKDRDTLTRIFLTYSKTDITSPQAIIGLLKLALNSADQPVRNVKFRGDTSPDPMNTFVTISDGNLATMRREFTQLKQAKGPAADTTENENARKSSGRKAVKRRGLAKGLIDVKSEVSKPEFTNAVYELADGNLPLYYPSVRVAEGGYAQTDSIRAYDIVSRTKKRYPSYRLSLYFGENGQYYGIQGTAWRNPPILEEAHRTTTRNGRKLELFGAPGGRYRLIAWRTERGVYWVSNTISNRLSNAQMLDIASNLRRVPG